MNLKRKLISTLWIALVFLLFASSCRKNEEDGYYVPQDDGPDTIEAYSD